MENKTKLVLVMVGAYVLLWSHILLTEGAESATLLFVLAIIGCVNVLIWRAPEQKDKK
jgi:hypothetical protein